VAIVGAGAAGLLAALTAARAGARVLLFETRKQPGAKIRVSGGGRCNVLPADMSLDDFHTGGSRHTLRNILFSWPLAAVRTFFETDLGVPLKAEPAGKLFPVSDRAQDVLQALLRANAQAGVTLLGAARVEELRRLVGRPGFALLLADGRRFEARRVVLASGGLSLPKTGSDGHGLALAGRLGVPAVPTYPALVPLLTADPRWKSLAGVAVRATVRAERRGRLQEEREGDFLFTHRGFSGPVVLDMSRHVTGPASAGLQLFVRWGGAATPDWENALRPAGNRQVATLLGGHLPARLAGALVHAARLAPDRRESELTRDERRALVEQLVRFPLPVAGSEGYATAEVTGGGVPLDAIWPKTLEARAVPGLHLCGEILDATGRIGGYNFLWAWVTGRRAGAAAAASLAAAAD
jgi:predicted Rossmann fold flavoprotein